MELSGGRLRDATYTVYDLCEESLSLKEGDCAVYEVLMDASNTIRLPKATENYGRTVFVYLTHTSGGVLTISAASEDSIAKGGAPVSSVSLNARGEYVLLYSSGLFWHECVSNGI